MTSIYYLIILSCILRAETSKNESNILRLGKPRDRSSSITTETPNSNGTERDEKEASNERRPLIGFSKNNPELDWKNYLKLFDEKEEEQRDLDVDFMKEKLEKTANSIQWLADLYDPLKWSRLPGKLDDNCRRDMEFFLKSLQDGKLWAAKSEYRTKLHRVPLPARR